MIDLIRVQSEPELAEVQKLFREYASSLRFNLCFQDFDKEIQELPGPYAPPEGRLFLAFDDGQPAGCIAYKPLAPGICEMKRLYVRSQFRAKGIGRMMAEQLVSDARFAGYKKMRLDTVAAQMPEAMGLYGSLGFYEIPAYNNNPVPGATFLEMDLNRNENISA